MKNILDEYESTPRRIGNAWSSLRGFLQSCSTQGIKEILGKASLPTFKILYDDTFKDPFLDEADKLVRALDADSRDRFVIGCIEEVVTLGDGGISQPRVAGVCAQAGQGGDRGVERGGG